LRSNRSNSRHAKFAEEFDPYDEDHYNARYAGAARVERDQGLYRGHRAAMGRRHEEMYDEEMHDDPPRRSWRRRLTALTLIAVGIYAYRTYVEPGSTQTSQVITAEETPSKVIPAISDPQSGKLIQDRLIQDPVGALRSGKRTVSGEQPVEPRSTGSTSRWAVRWAVPSAPALPPQGAASATDTISSDPMWIATLGIRPDGTEVSGRRVASPPPGTSASAAPSQAKPVQRTERGVPFSPDPRAGASDAAPAPPAQRPLTPPTAATPAPAAAANAAAGGYVVQVSSQRSEVDAQAYFRFLQEKFPSELEGRTAIIRRADLGAKGIYYRVVTGPFASADEADQFCGNLKAAGGTCIIQRN
jgi:cell division septation protein DedD